MRFIELFAGIGGFRHGLEPLGWQCVWANEIDPYACRVYRKNFGDKELFEGDIDWILESPNLIYSQPDFPVSHFRSPVSEGEVPIQEISGLLQSARFAYYDQDTPSWKTFQESLALGDQPILGEYLETWPRAGIMHNGIVSRLQPSAPLTEEIEFGYMHIPTVTVQDSTGRQYQYSGGDHSKKVLTLAGYAKKYPTLTSRDYRSGMSKETLKRRQSESSRGVNLSEHIQRIEGNNGKLNPAWAEWLMGYKTGWTELNV